MEQKSEMNWVQRSTVTSKSTSKLLRQWYAQADQARAEGKPVVWCMVGVPPEILHTIEVCAVWPENYGTVCASRHMAVHFMQFAEAEGYSTDLCSYERNASGYCRRYMEAGGIPPEAPMGGLPAPAMILAPGTLCDPRIKGFQSISTRYFHSPTYFLDLQSVPYGTDIDDALVKQRYMAHNTAQIKGLITFIEEHTGRNLPLDKLREIVERSVKTQRLICEIHQLRRAIPSPMPSEDQFACIIPQLYMVGSEEALDFYERLYAEVNDRVERKVGVVEDERFRLMWMGLPTWFNMGIFNYLESLGAPSVIETTYYVYDPGEVDTSDPVRALAEIYWNKNKLLHDLGAESTPELGAAGAGLVVHFAREYKLDGVIMHNTRSCRAIAFGQAHAHKRLQEELGTPVLFLESDMADPRQWSDERIKGQINTFLELLASRKGTA